jgi:hypothetical protein
VGVVFKVNSALLGLPKRGKLKEIFDIVSIRSKKGLFYFSNKKGTFLKPSLHIQNPQSYCSLLALTIF